MFKYNCEYDIKPTFWQNFSDKIKDTLINQNKQMVNFVIDVSISVFCYFCYNKTNNKIWIRLNVKLMDSYHMIC